eukprot:CAMPEP_0206056136 /NCGR_PEP_ID=MMETSP1466-20131121/41541_1 /ASSEMBLY_ACC=CAM_ASM_001126 /TAXON_ID=44452 /ORGANISM="Pavlova gyrans, Strain CCMP608" /LENGTH=30 /DNA_ID= /DNA_START= /DNA_END= /DNA_ORIENTATION=
MDGSREHGAGCAQVLLALQAVALREEGRAA